MKDIKADLHNHLKTGSYMPEGIFNKTIDVAQERLGDGGIVGLVNFEDRRYEDFSDLWGYDRHDFGNCIYIPEKEIIVVKGQEVPTEQGHLLVLGLMRDVRLKAGRTLEDTIKEARDNNGILIADHPFYLQGIGHYLKKNHELVYELDGIEVHNGEAALGIFGFTPINANQKAEDFVSKLGLDIVLAGAREPETKRPGIISSSDGHSLYELGRNYTVLRVEDESMLAISEEFNKNLRGAIKDSRHKYVSINSKIGALKHMFDLGLIIAASKIGISLKNI
ncbi:MAG: hypothetical protein ABH840_02060 [Nanoarchaeota archaeon]